MTKQMAYAVIAFYLIFVATGCGTFGQAPKSIQQSQAVVLESSKTLEENVHQALNDLKSEAKDGRAAAIGLALKHEGERIGAESATPAEAIQQYQEAEKKAAELNQKVATTLDQKTDERILMLEYQFAVQRQFSLLVDKFNKTGIDATSINEIASMVADLTSKYAKARSAQAATTGVSSDTAAQPQWKSILDLIKQNAGQQLLQRIENYNWSMLTAPAK